MAPRCWPPALPGWLCKDTARRRVVGRCLPTRRQGADDQRSRCPPEVAVAAAPCRRGRDGTLPGYAGAVSRWPARAFGFSWTGARGALTLAVDRRVPPDGRLAFQAQEP